MATYFEIVPRPSWTSGQIYNKIAGLLEDNYSVEVVAKGETVILRVWESKHCRLGDHEKVEL